MSIGVTPTFRPPIVIASFVEIGVVMPISWAMWAILAVPTLSPTSAKTELSEKARAFVRVRCADVRAFVVVHDEHFAFEFGTWNSLIFELQTDSGRDPVLERRGEIEDLEGRPRLALALGGEVEGRVRRSCDPPTIARTLPVEFSIATSAAVGSLASGR